MYIKKMHHLIKVLEKLIIRVIIGLILMAKRITGAETFSIHIKI